jgi:hypothetical protein
LKKLIVIELFVVRMVEIVVFLAILAEIVLFAVRVVECFHRDLVKFVIWLEISAQFSLDSNRAFLR